MTTTCIVVETPASSATQDHFLAETSRQRNQAQALLRSLNAAKSECERQLARFQRTDAMQTVTGRSALETAIAQTQRMIESLDRAAATRSPEARF